MDELYIFKQEVSESGIWRRPNNFDDISSANQIDQENNPSCKDYEL